jgi:ribosomal protein S18 acetylase RimI-like enzyme
MVIKIEPLFATDSTQMRAILRHQNERVPYESFCAEDAIARSGLTFWQHWLPCRWHFAPSAYVAKEDGVVIGLISLVNIGKARACWRVTHLVVHPHHRGRGIAQELLRYVFALFGSQGVSHFVAELSNDNNAALSLLGSCGFRCAARLVYYRLSSESKGESETPDLFRLATPADAQGLHQLHQDALPPDLRLIYDYVADDFLVHEIPVEPSERLFRRLLKNKVWYWVSEDKERKVLTAAVKVTAHREGDYHLEFAVHPGWSHLAADTVAFALNMVNRNGMKGLVLAKAYDYQPSVGEALSEADGEKEGEFFLMAREHWLRAKQPRALKIDRAVALPQIANPAINMPRLLKFRPPQDFPQD